VQSVIGFKWTRLAAAAVLLMAGGSPAAGQTAPAAETQQADVKAVMDTIQSLSGLLDGLEATANAAAPDDSKASAAAGANANATATAKRPVKNTIAIITAGAAAGASIGAATKKGTQAIVIGAVAGAAAGLIYDRMTANKQNTESSEAGAKPDAPAPPRESVPVAPKPAT